MATNQHESSLSPVTGSLTTINGLLTNVEQNSRSIVGGDLTQFHGGTATTKSATSVLMLSIATPSYLFLMHFNDAASAGSTVYVYMGVDNTYPLFKQCSLAASGCESVLPTYVYSPNGWSVYLKNDGTHYSTISYSYYMGIASSQQIIISSKDTYLEEHAPTTNHGTETGAQMNYMYANYHNNGLIYFDISSLPAGLTLTGATMILRMSGLNYGNYVSIYGVLASWIEAEATWNERSSGVNWSSAGCNGSADRRSVAEWTGYVRFVTPSFYAIDVTNIVKEWYAGTLTNNGLCIITDAIYDYFTTSFNTHEVGTAAWRPQLLIHY